MPCFLNRKNFFFLHTDPIFQVQCNRKQLFFVTPKAKNETIYIYMLRPHVFLFLFLHVPLFLHVHNMPCLLIKTRCQNLLF